MESFHDLETLPTGRTTISTSEGHSSRCSEGQTTTVGLPEEVGGQLLA